MKKALHSSETLVLARATRHNVPEGGILHSHRRKNLKSYIALTGWALSLVWYELGFYIPEDGILHSHRRENLKYYMALTDWKLWQSTSDIQHTVPCYRSFQYKISQR
jgi:hypothetical protein